MGWRRARFKDADIWVQVDAKGEPAAQGGRVPVRYSDAPGAKVYRAGASRVGPPSGPVLELDAGVAADAAAKTRSGRGSGFGKAGTRTAQQAALAKDAARDLIESLPEDTIRVFTDGACRGNPGPAGAGTVVELPDGRRLEAARSLGRATNNVGELAAIGTALELLDEAGVSPEAPVAVFTDSDYATGVLTRGWKAKANRELIEGIRGRLKERPGVVLHWIAGHVGVPGNERADELANLGVSGESFTRRA